LFKLWSIKRLLKLWSLATIMAIVVIASVAIYTNGMFSESQQDFTDKVLPIENASRQITSVATALITRQKQVIASTSIDAIEDLVPREQLVKEFSNQLSQIELLVENNSDMEIITSLSHYYQDFLDVDSQLLALIIEQHNISNTLTAQVQTVEELQHRIQSQVEAVSGKLTLKQSIARRAAKASEWGGYYESSRENELDAIQKLSQSIQLNVLKISYLTQRLLLTENVDTLLSIRDNSIRQHETILKSSINKLYEKLSDEDLLALTERLKASEAALMASVIHDDLAIYNLRLKQLHNYVVLAEGEKKSNILLKEIASKLNELSTIVSDQSLKTVDKSTEVSKKAKYLIIILGLLITLGMMRFIVSISKRVNKPLAELRNAMRALSSMHFDTRLKVTEGKSEFAVLATDFNLFAANTQNLIVDLADAKDSLQARERHIFAILNGVPEAILTLTPAGEITTTNPTAERVLKANESNLIGLNFSRFLDEDYQQTSLERIEQLLLESRELEGRDYNNQPFSMWMSLKKISNLKEELWVCVISDITAWKRTEAQLKTTSSELNAILENAMVGIALIKGRALLRVNHKFEQLFDCNRNQVEGQSTRCLYPSNDIYETLGEEAYGTLEKGESYVGEVQLKRQDGSLFWGMMSGKALDPSDPHLGSIWLFEDITLQRENDDKLRRLASLDTLTGLPNRAVFNDRLEHAIRKASRSSTRLAVFFLDLDHFKHINDSLGHKAGDILLCDVGKRLKTCVRDDDTVARLGGDEFTIILEQIRSAQHVAKVAEKILRSISQTYTIEGTEVSVSPSVGISLYPADGRDVDILVRNADAAMYHAKSSGRNNFQFYSGEMNAQAAKRLAMETALRRALEQNEFYLCFQPQIELATGAISGSEALLRWNSEQWGEVSPAEFVPILEDTGLIGEVGKIVLKQAVQAYLSLKDKLSPDFQMAVNLSGRQFQGGLLADFVKNLLLESGMSAKNLELEITESILMDDADLAVSTLDALSKLGIALAIDDFGTGYSSLSYLKRFPLNVLKIDRSFVRDVIIDKDDAAIVDAILAMSRRLNLKVVAEGVETEEQLDFLQQNECDRVQGYFFSKPLSLEDFSHFIDVNEHVLM